jgi:hypothetical protein
VKEEKHVACMADTNAYISFVGKPHGKKLP